MLCAVNSTYTAIIWRLHNYDQEAMLTLETRSNEDTVEASDDVNRSRKKAQTLVGDRLARLERRWNALVSQNLSIRVATLTARAEAAEYSRRTQAAQAELAKIDAA